MIPSAATLLLAALTAQSPQADSLRQLALRLPPSRLVIQAKVHPIAIREAVGGALARGQLEVAKRLAAAHALAWRDSFLVRDVARFAAWTPGRRAGRVWADSVRRYGITVYGRAGARAGIGVWRRALARAEALGDSVSMASLLGNVGAALLEDGAADSAASCLERARALAAGVGDLRVQANAIHSLADVREEQGDLAGARTLFAQAMALREWMGDDRGLAAERNDLGLLAETAGDLAEARRLFESALELNRRDGADAAATNLVNLAGLASLDGDFTRADTLYHQALSTWRAKEMWAEAADALHGLGQLETRRGDYPAARAALAQALAAYRRTGSPTDVLAVEGELAGVLAAQGDLQGALDTLHQAERHADSAAAAPDQLGGITLAHADLAVQLNAFSEAERWYARAEGLYRQAGDQAGQAQAQEGRGFLFLERGDPAAARPLLESSVRAQGAVGDRRSAALTRLSLSRLAAARGDTAEARAQVMAATDELREVGDPVALAWATGKRAELDAQAGLYVTAESLYREGLSELGERVAPEVAWQLRRGRALVLRAQGLLDDAAQELRLALAEIERPRRSLALAERRAGFMADKWDAYVQLALIEQARGRPGAAFDASERLRAREMLELLDRGRVEATAGTPTDLVEREQDLRRRIGELTAEMEHASASAEGFRGPNVSLAKGTTREVLLRAQEQYAELLLETKDRAPRHAALVSPAPTSWREIAQRLRPSEALVEYLVSDSASLAFVVTPDTVAVVDLGVGRRELTQLIEFARGTLDPGRRSAVDSLWRAPLRRLHGYLIAPIEQTGLLAGKKRLVVVPHGELHYLPFAALLRAVGPDRFLIEDYDLLVTPSASAWLTLSRRPPGRAGQGILALAPRADALPATEHEVAAVARLGGPDARALTGRAASEAAFRRAAPTARVLHLATYGVLNKENPLFSYVDLGPGAGDDGRLEVHEVFGLDLAADLVVLSACQTALGSGRLADVPPGDDWVSLTSAFLQAGAAHVVATLWPVEDQATAALMERFYQDYASGADPAQALAAAQRTLLTTPATEHPFYWAGVEAVGSAERRGP